MKKLKTLVFILLFYALSSLIVSINVAPVSATNWLTGWNYRKSHVINSASGAGTNYQVCIKVYKTTGADGTENVNGVTAGKVYVGTNCRDDFGDIRFSDSSGNVLIDCWMESYVSATSAIFWVEISGNLSAGSVTIYVYYGKSDATYPYLATDLAQGEATFLFFDNFNDSSYDTNKWSTVSGSPVESSGYLNVAAAKVRSVNTFGTSIRIKANSRASDAERWMLGIQNSGNTLYSAFWRVSGGFRAPENYNGTEHYALATLPTVNVWHLFEMLWKASTSCYCYIDSSNPTYDNTYTCSSAQPLFFESNINNPNLDVDWIFVSKWQASEPSHGTWGGEESNTVAYSFGLSGSFHVVSGLVYNVGLHKFFSGSFTPSGVLGWRVGLHFGLSEGLKFSDVSRWLCGLHFNFDTSVKYSSNLGMHRGVFYLFSGDTLVIYSSNSPSVVSVVGYGEGDLNDAFTVGGVLVAIVMVALGLIFITDKRRKKNV